MTSVYLIRAGKTDNYKIGISQDIDKRLGTLQTAHYERLTVVHISTCDTRFIALTIEEELHNKYKPFNTIGEWFKFSNNQIETVKNEFDSMQVSEVIGLKARIKELETEVTTLNSLCTSTKDDDNRVDKILKKRNDIDIVSRMYQGGVIKIGDKLTPRAKVAIKNNRSESEKVSKIYTTLADSGVIERVGNKGYYARADYQTALSVINGAI